MTDIMQQAFNGGVLSPQVWGQMDHAKYKTGLKTAENWVALPHGALINRPGTEFISAVKDSSKPVALAPFVAAVDAAYILELGDDYARFYTDGARIDTQQMIKNRGMEQDNCWDSVGAVTTNERSKEQIFGSGSVYSRKFVTTGAGQGIKNTTKFTVKDSVQYTWIAYVYPSVASIDTKIAGGTVHENQTDSGLSLNTWQQITGTFTPGADDDDVQLQFLSSAAAGTGTFYIDSVYLSQDDPCEVETPYSQTEVDEIDFAQSLDELYIAHEDHMARVLKRYETNGWFFEYHDYGLSIVNSAYKWTASGSGTSEYYLELAAGGDPGLDKPFRVAEGEHMPVQDWATRGGIASGLGPRAEYLEATLGSLVAGNWGFGDNDTLGYDTIYVRTSGSVDPDTLAVDRLWADQMPPDFESLNPTSVVFQNDRLVWTRGEKIYASRVGIYNDHTGVDEGDDDDAMELRLGDGQASNIHYVRAYRGLTLLTIGAEWLVTGADSSSLITANSKKAEPAGQSGSDRVRPLSVDNVMLHALRHSKGIKELVYDYSSERFVGAELSILAEHYFDHYSILRMAYQRHPFKIVWILRSDGKLLSLTYHREQKVYAWTEHDINGTIEDIAVIPGDGRDELWMVVRRTINSSTARYIERMDDFFKKPDRPYDYFLDDDTTDAHFLDSRKTLDNRVDIIDITQADPAVVTTNGNHDWSNGDVIRIRDVVGFTDPTAELRTDENGTVIYGQSGVNGFDFIVRNKTNNTAELEFDGADLDATGFSAYISGGTGAKKVTSVTGLSAWEGEDLSVVADGQYIGEYTVSSGTITLAEAASVIHTGYKYNSDAETLPPRIEFKDGIKRSQEKNINAFMMELHETTGLQYGWHTDRLVEIDWLNMSVRAGLALPLFSGDTPEFSFAGPLSTQPTMIIRQNLPMPATIKMINMDVEVDNG
jgi:hypothetical protein